MQSVRTDGENDTNYSKACIPSRVYESSARLNEPDSSAHPSFDRGALQPTNLGVSSEEGRADNCLNNTNH